MNQLDQIGEISRHARAWSLPATTADIRIDRTVSPNIIRIRKPHVFYVWAKHLTEESQLIRAGGGELHVDGRLLCRTPIRMVCPFPEAQCWRVLCLGDLYQLITKGTP